MRLKLKSQRRRAAGATQQVAAGSALPAGSEPEPRDRPAKPSARERGAMRRRVRHLRRRREAMLMELGALVLELQRRERSEPELVARKAGEVRVVDDEERGLSAALGEDRLLVEVVAAGIAGTCPACGTLVGTEARYCHSCGTPVRGGAVPPSSNGNP